MLKSKISLFFIHMKPNLTNKSDDLNEQIKKWWEQNPFTFGVATNDYKRCDLVGRMPIENMDMHYFEEIERKFRKHTGTGIQEIDQPLLSKLIDFSLIKNKDVLDIAVGSGLHLVTFAKAGARVTGIDLTPFAVSQANRNLELRHLQGRVLQMDAQCMKFPENSFNFINAWGCLMHMPDTEKAVKEIYRVLKPGGQVLAYMYNKSSWPFWFNIFFLRGILLGGLIRYKGNIDKLTSRYSDGSHNKGNILTKFITPKKAKEIFKRAGFNEVKALPLDISQEPNHWPMGSFPIFSYLPSKIKAWMSKRWGYGLIIRSKK